LICTSGNLDGDPLVSGVNESDQRLKNMADVFLHHDRDIAHPIDDSVVRMIANRAVTIRCARGIAPLPLEIDTDARCLALGGNQKSAVALSNGCQSLLGPHIGDLISIAAQEQFGEQLRNLCDLVRITPNDLRVMHDPHPDYFSTRWNGVIHANRTAAWHHHSHIVAGMLEHRWLDRKVLGVAFDGTGLGTDGSIWGGEFLLATATQFERVGHLRTFGLPGGDSAIADPRKIGVSVLSQIEGLQSDEIGELLGLLCDDVGQIRRLLDSRWTSQTTSCGRLFDAAASIILRQSISEFEGQAAMRLEAECDPAETGEYSFVVVGTGPVEIDWRPAFQMMINDRHFGVAPKAMAMRFHRGLATAIIKVCSQWADLPVIVGGGVFQNRVLVELLVKQWPAGRAPLGLPGLIPPNDGGLAAGQLAIASMLETN
jgi:hydrogenase maturation protein HypF